MATVAEQLREQIDKQYQEAVAAYEIVARYLSNSQASNGNGVATPAAVSVAPVHGEGGIRERVIAAISSEWRNIGQIATLTGLDKKQIRGVVNAPSLKDDVKRKTEADVTYYKFVKGE